MNINAEKGKENAELLGKALNLKAEMRNLQRIAEEVGINAEKGEENAELFEKMLN